MMDEVTFSRAAAYVAWSKITDPRERIAFLDAVRASGGDIDLLPRNYADMIQRRARIAP